MNNKARGLVLSSAVKCHTERMEYTEKKKKKWFLKSENGNVAMVFCISISWYNQTQIYKT